MKKIVNKITLKGLLLLVFTALFALSGCAGRTGGVYAETRYALGTVISVTTYSKADRDASVSALSKLPEYERIFSAKDPESEVGYLNAHQGEATEVSEALFSVLKHALNYYRLSDGKFSPALGFATALYDFSGQKTVPDEADVSAAMERSDAGKITLISPNTVLIAEDGPALDLGAIAKGKIADLIAEDLKAAGVENAIVNAGGDLVLIGGKPAKDGTVSPFRVGIQKPEKGSPENVKILEAENCAVVTSGVYERAFEKDGVTWHHLLDAGTGLPFDPVSAYGADVVSVTVIAKRAEQADALATTLFFLGPEASKKALTSFPGVRAIFLLSDLQTVEIQ